MTQPYWQQTTLSVGYHRRMWIGSKKNEGNYLDFSDFSVKVKAKESKPELQFRDKSRLRRSGKWFARPKRSRRLIDLVLAQSGHRLHRHGTARRQIAGPERRQRQDALPLPRTSTDLTRSP